MRIHPLTFEVFSCSGTDNRVNKITNDSDLRERHVEQIIFPKSVNYMNLDMKDDSYISRPDEK
jgi:hypothetical protein